MFNIDDMMINQKYDKQKKYTTANGKYFISTNDTWDQGWETMVFAVDSNGDIDYTELDVDHYNDQKEAYAGHEQMIKKWEAKS